VVDPTPMVAVRSRRRNPRASPITWYVPGVNAGAL
jgi:hypothetical protein